MSKKDLRREQIKLLRFEKALRETMTGKVVVGVGLASIAALLGPLRGVAQRVEAELSDPKVGEVSQAIFAAFEASRADLGVYLHTLASAAQAAHAYVEVQAIDLGFRILQVSGGDCKDCTPPAALTLLGLG